MWFAPDNNRLKQVIPGPFREPHLLKLLPEEVVYFAAKEEQPYSFGKLEDLSKMSALPCPMPKVTCPSNPSQDKDQGVYVYDPHINKWIKWKSLSNKYEVNNGCHRKDKEEKFVPICPENEYLSNQVEVKKNCAEERKISDWLIPDRDETMEEEKMRPKWEKICKKKPKRCFGTTEIHTEEEVCQSLKHFLDIPCLSLESLQTAVSENSHHINLNGRDCKTEEEIKDLPSKASKETKNRGTRPKEKDSGNRCRITKRHLWQMVDENDKLLPFGAVSFGKKGPNDEKQDGADIWIRLDCVSVLITRIVEEMEREQEDRFGATNPKGEMQVAKEEEDSSSQENQCGPAEESEFVEIPLERSSPEYHSYPVEEKLVNSSELCCHKTSLTEYSTDESLPHPKQTTNSLETQSSSISHEDSGEGSSEIQIADVCPSTSSSSESQGKISCAEMCKTDSESSCNEPSHRKAAERVVKEYRRHRIFPRFTSQFSKVA